MSIKNIIILTNGFEDSNYDLYDYKLPIGIGGSQKNVIYELEILKLKYKVHLLVSGVDEINKECNAKNINLLALNKPFDKSLDFLNLIYSLLSSKPLNIENFSSKEAIFLVHGKFISALLFKLFKPNAKTILFIEGTFIKLAYNLYLNNIFLRIIYFILSCFALLFVDKIFIDNKKSFLFNMPLLKKKTIYIPNSIDLNKFKPSKYKLNNLKKLLYVGRLDFAQQKNPELLIEAFSKALAKRDDLELTIICAKEELIKKLESRFSNVKGKIILYQNPIPNDQLVDLYSKSDLLLLTSKFEGTPITLLEALACGTPCVITNIVDKLLIVDHVNGYVSKSYSPDDFAESILKGLELSLDTKPREISLLPKEYDLKYREANLLNSMEL